MGDRTIDITKLNEESRIIQELRSIHKINPSLESKLIINILNSGGNPQMSLYKNLLINSQSTNKSANKNINVLSAYLSLSVLKMIKESEFAKKD